MFHWCANFSWYPSLCQPKKILCLNVLVICEALLLYSNITQLQGCTRMSKTIIMVIFVNIELPDIVKIMYSLIFFFIFQCSFIIVHCPWTPLLYRGSSWIITPQSGVDVVCSFREEEVTAVLQKGLHRIYYTWQNENPCELGVDCLYWFIPTNPNLFEKKCLFSQLRLCYKL